MTRVDFLGIGAQKSATSWLFNNLQNHPDIWMPPRKELHYFDRDLSYCSPSFLATDTLNERLLSSEDHNILFRKKMDKEIGFAKDSGNIKDIEWYEKYFCEDISDNWYRSLFVESKGRVKGEITPAYSILRNEDIEHIKELFPDIKLILLLRDPIERAWSHLRFLFKIGRFENTISIEEIKDFIDSPFQTTRGNYPGIISKWLKVFSSSNFFIGYYDEVIENPKSLLCRLFNFLEVDPAKNNFDDLNTKSNVSNSVDMPKEISEHLVAKYFKEIKKLSAIYQSSYPSKWLNKYK